VYQNVVVPWQFSTDVVVCIDFANWFATIVLNVSILWVFINSVFI